MFARCPSVACGRRNIPIHPIRQCLRCFALDRSEVERVSGRYSVYCFGIDLVLKVTKIGGHSQWVLSREGLCHAPAIQACSCPGSGRTRPPSTAPLAGLFWITIITRSGSTLAIRDTAAAISVARRVVLSAG